MRRLLVLAICTLLLAAVGPILAGSDTVVRVERGSPQRAGILDTVRPLFIVETSGPIEFVVNTLNTMDGWAFGDVQLQRPGGVPIDWSKTKFAEAYAAGAFEAQHTLFLLRDTGGGWSLVEFAVGPTDIAWDWWRQQHGLPETLFTK
jgi:hypothetical protein